MQTFRLFMAGFLTVALLHLFATCSHEDNPTSPAPGLNVEQIHASAKKVEDAFRSADSAAVMAVLTEEAQAQYGKQLNGFVPRMPEFADAIRSRQLTAYSEGYAVYIYTTGNRTLSFALALQDLGDWKLTRF